MKDNMLEILPGKLQTDFLWHSKDKDVGFNEFRNLVVTVSARLMNLQRPSRPLRGVASETEQQEEQESEGSMTFDSFFRFGSVSS